MNTKIISSVMLAMLALYATCFTSCKKDKPKPDTETQTAIDQGVAENEFSYQTTEINSVAINEKGLQKKTYSDTCIFSGKGCAGCIQTMTIVHCDSVFGYPKTVTLDFGTAGTCQSCDGRYRKGKLIIVYSGPWLKSGSQATVTTENYLVDANKISATVVLTNLINSDTLSISPKFSRVVSGTGGAEFAAIETSTGTIKFKCNQTIEHLSGFITPHIFIDDVISIFGTAGGVNRKGRAYAVNIAESAKIKKAASCKWIQDGTVEVTPDNLATRSIDYAYPSATGSGVCDSKAQVTVNGNSFEIDLE